MQKGEHKWDTDKELRTRCEMTCCLDSGHKFFTGGKHLIAGATLMPDGKTLDITVRVDRIVEIMREHAQAKLCIGTRWKCVNNHEWVTAHGDSVWFAMPVCRVCNKPASSQRGEWIS